MAFTPTYKGRGSTNATGWFPIYADRGFCCYCKSQLAKVHGLNKWTWQDGKATVQAFFAFGTGPWCLPCSVKEAWKNPDFFNRSGSNEYSARRWDLDRQFRPQFPSMEEEMKRL